MNVEGEERTPRPCTPLDTSAPMDELSTLLLLVVAGRLLVVEVVVPLFAVASAQIMQHLH